MKALYNKAVLTGLLSITAFCLLGCQDRFAELNKDNNEVYVAVPSYFMAKAVQEFDPCEYTNWFYNAKMFGKWTGLHLSGAYNGDFFQMTATGKQGSQSVKMLKYRNKILKEMKNENTEKYKAYASVCDILAIYCGLSDSDVYGSIPYTEAALYPDGPLTPKYDTVENLYTLWISTLDECIKNFQDETQEFEPSQDVVYNGDTGKWAKLANSLKLRIAVRLLNSDPARAKSIVENLVTSDAGYIDSIEDAFMFSRGTSVSSGNDDVIFHFGDAINNDGLVPWDGLVNFMVNSYDPRVRFLYTKNDFNKRVIDLFIEENRSDDLPSSVKNNYDIEKKSFKGDPSWSRYVGYPAVWKESVSDETDKEFFSTGTRYSISIGDNKKTYTPVSHINEEMIRGRVDFTLPNRPDDPAYEDYDNVPWTGLYLGPAEVELYLAEFALLGYNVAKNAEDLYNSGVRHSVNEIDRLAALNRIPQYSEATLLVPPAQRSLYEDAPLCLKDGEIDALMASDNIKLTGNVRADLEKVYIQQIINFTLLPNEQFVTSRRSGYPSFNSGILQRVKLTNVGAAGIPRRFEVGIPQETDIMYNVKMEAYTQQNITPGVNQSGAAYLQSTVLNTERLWMDQNAPQWGMGGSFMQ